jgi:2-methylcitrate dehydratase PrpD
VSEQVPLADRLSRFVAETAFDQLPAEVVESVKLRVLDTVGICLAATGEGLGDGVAEFVAASGGREAAHLIARGGSYPAQQAALVNGTLAHSLDFDDTHLPSVLHPSASIVPAALAMGEAAGRSGPEVIAAVALGIELTVRLGMGGYLSEGGNIWFERGWHATSICGTLGAAAIGAKLLGLAAPGIRDALGIAASMAGGVIEANRSGGTVKRLHCGWAAHAGLTAAALAQHGYSGPPTVLEGRFGLYQAFLDGRYDPEPILEGLGERWETPGIYFKPYPANHYTHAGIDAALAIRRQHDLSPDEIERIELGAAKSALRTIGEPREEKIRPRSGYHAQFSGPFTVATALLGGGGLGVYFDDFTDEKAGDPALLALAAKVQTFVDPACDAVFPRGFPAVLRIHLHDGTIYEERVMDNRGGPARPLSEAELRQKFLLNAEQILPREQAEALASTISSLEQASELGTLLRLTQAEPGGSQSR